jgi:hypothetical protein
MELSSLACLSFIDGDKIDVPQVAINNVQYHQISSAPQQHLHVGPILIFHDVPFVLTQTVHKFEFHFPHHFDC